MKTDHPESDRNRYIVQAADVALQLLILISKKPNLTLDEVAKLADINKSRCMRLLVTLEARRLVRKDTNGRWSLGLESMLIGNNARAQLNIAEVIQPALDKLRDETGETAQFRVLSNLTSICIAQADSNHEMRVHAKLGKPQELYIGSAKVILAFDNTDLLKRILEQPLKRYTEKTIDSPEKLKEQMAEIRSQGYSVSIGEKIQYAMALGAPVRNSDGSVMSCVSLLGPEERIKPHLDNHIQALLATAYKISLLMGWSN